MRFAYRNYKKNERRKTKQTPTGSSRPALLVGTFFNYYTLGVVPSDDDRRPPNFWTFGRHRRRTRRPVSSTLGRTGDGAYDLYSSRFLSIVPPPPHVSFSGETPPGRRLFLVTHVNDDDVARVRYNLNDK